MVIVTVIMTRGQVPRGTLGVLQIGVLCSNLQYIVFIIDVRIMLMTMAMMTMITTTVMMTMIMTGWR